MAKLTDKQRKQIIAERAEGASLRKLADKYNVSPTTIKRTLVADPETVKKVAQKKEENTQEVLAYMDSRKNQVCKIINLGLEQIPEKLSKLNAVQIATTLGIIIDKFTAGEIKSGNSGTVEDLSPLVDMLREKDNEK
ncbi:MAG: helix-turn-helix domain-containing protein [Firmicutes bacterium]|nr:helix-turn-helix domain-containing protein [Bacillota bacterium]